MRYITEIMRKAHSSVLRFLLAGSDTLHSRSRSMSTSGPFLWARLHGFQKYAVAVLSVTVALILSRWPALHLESAPASLLYCAIMLSAWFGGFRPGFFAAII